jgi:hypothetical protein
MSAELPTDKDPAEVSGSQSGNNLPGGKPPRRFGFLPIALTLIVAGSILLNVVVFRAKNTFPPMPAAAYVGKLSGVTGSSTEFATLFVERFKGSNTFLFVVLREGWKPQAIAMARVEGTNAKLTEDVPYQPVEIRSDSRRFTLIGSGTAKKFSGDVLSSDGVKGTWSVSEISEDVLSVDSAAAGLELKQWLDIKTRLGELRAQAEAELERYSYRKDRLEKLQKFIGQEELLRDRALKRRDLLADEVSRARAEKEKTSKALAGYIDELDTLKRITKRGQVVDLARRVATRESKWYLANWGEGTDVSSLEETLAERENVDLVRLESAYKKATEIRDLKNGIEREREAISELENKLLRGETESIPVQTGPGSEEPPAGGASPSTPEKKDGNWWNKMFG